MKALLRVTALVVGVVVCAFTPRPAGACFCDKDSAPRESKARPLVAPVVLGRWRPRSPHRDLEQLPALELLTAGAQGTPRSFDELADANHRLGRTGQAIDVMNRKLGRFGEDADTHARLASLHGLAGNRHKAAAQIARALALATPDAAAQFRVEAMVIDYLARLEDDPELARADLLGLSLLTVAEPVPSRPRQRGPAEELAVMIQRGWDDNPHVWFALGRSLAHDGDSRLALHAFHRAANLGHPGAKRETCETAKRFVDLVRGGFYCPEILQALDRAWSRGAAARRVP